MDVVVNDQLKVDGSLCLFIIFTILLMAVKRVLTVFVELCFLNVCYADVLHSKDVIFF